MSGGVSSSKLQIQRSKNDVRLSRDDLQCEFLSCVCQEDLPTIADRGTSADIVNMRVAQILVAEGIVDGIHQPGQDVQIQFGVESAKVPVAGVIYGRGLIGEVYVVDAAVPISLISDISMVEKGVLFIEDSQNLIGLAGGRVVVTGFRDNKAQRSDSSAMWKLNLRELLLEEDPRVSYNDNEKACQIRAEDIVNIILLQQQHEMQGSQDLESNQCMAAYGAKPTYSVEDVRNGRRVLKCLGVSPFTFARTVEREAVKNIPKYLTPALLRAIGHARGNIPAIMTTARKQKAGGTGIKSKRVGEVVSFDILGKFPVSVWGCQYGVMFLDEASDYLDGYGIKSKSDIDEALVRYCQAVQARGKGPVRRARYDAGAEASKHGELTVAFRKACERLHLQLVPSAPEDQATNPVERQWQSISHRMANMFLQQENLTKQQWILVWFAAMVIDRVVCHGLETRTPCEIMCDFVPDIEHVSKFYCGETVIFPRTGKKQHMSPGHEVGVHICPILANKAHLVLIGNNSTPQVRSHLQSVGVELRDLTANELEKLNPTFDEESGDLIDFYSRAQHKFSLKRAIQDYDDGMDLQGMEGVADTMAQNNNKILEQEMMPYLGPVESKMINNKQQQHHHHNNQTADVEDKKSTEASVVTDVAQESEGVAYANDVAVNMSLITYVTNLLLAGEVRMMEDEGMVSCDNKFDRLGSRMIRNQTLEEQVQHLDLNSFKARAIHTERNPTVRMLEKDKKLAELWQPATHKEISGGIAKGFRIILTEEEKIQEGWIEQPLVLVYSTKRDGNRKCRAASDGRAMPASWFDPDDIYAEGLPPMITRLITAFGARFKMVDASTDVVSCFASQCTWDKSKYPRLICHRLTAYQSPTGKEEWLGNLTNNYGSCDSPGQWRMISRDALINKYGMIPSRVCDQLYMKFKGEQGLLVIGQMTDDFKLLHTDDEDGKMMKEELLRVLQKELGWEMTQQTQTKDYGSLIHTFEVIDGRRAVTLTQEAQIIKTVELVYGADHASVPATYIPLPPEWSAEASVRCQESVTQKAYMGGLMTAAWTLQTHFESPAISLLACRGSRPTVVDMVALQHYVAYLHTTRKIGVTYYETLEAKPDIRRTVGLRLYTDDGENQHLDGAGHWGVLIYLGESDDGSGAIVGISQKATGVIGESVPINEVMGALYGIRIALYLKFILEELSGATAHDLDTTEITVEGSADPLSCVVPRSVVKAVQHQNFGHLGEPALDIAAVMLSESRCKDANYEASPMQVFLDNAGVVNNISHISSRSKGLKRVARVVAHLRSLLQNDVVRYIHTSSEEQRADSLSKQYVSPVQNAEAMVHIFGSHPILQEYILLVHKLFNKRTGGKRPDAAGLQTGKQSILSDTKTVDQWVQESDNVQGEDGVDFDFNGISFMHNAAARPMIAQRGGQRAAMQNMQNQHKFLRFGKGAAERIMVLNGYKGVGGLGANEDGISVPIEASRRGQTGKEGIGFHGNQGLILHKARVGGILDKLSEEDTGTAGIFLAERIRRALMKLTPEERFLFSTRLHDGPFEDLLISDGHLSRLVEGTTSATTEGKDESLTVRQSVDVEAAGKAVEEDSRMLHNGNRSSRRRESRSRYWQLSKKKQKI